VEALSAVMDYARTHHSSNHIEWNDVIKALGEMLTHRDMRWLVTQSNDNKVRKGFDRHDQDVYHTWKASFIRINRYHLIMRGVSGWFHEEEVFKRDVYPENYDPDESDDDADLVLGRMYYLAYQMMSAYHHWLCLHPEEEAVFMQGFMVSASRCLYSPRDSESNSPSYSLFIETLQLLEGLQGCLKIHAMGSGIGWGSIWLH
jgi:hypothetical protein